MKYQKLSYTDPSYFFVPKDFSSEGEYSTGFSVDELMSTYSTGIETQKDNIAIQFDRSTLEKIISDFQIEPSDFLYGLTLQ